MALNIKTVTRGSICTTNKQTRTFYWKYLCAFSLKKIVLSLYFPIEYGWGLISHYYWTFVCNKGHYTTESLKLGSTGSTPGKTFRLLWKILKSYQNIIWIHTLFPQFLRCKFTIFGDFFNLKAVTVLRERFGIFRDSATQFVYKHQIRFIKVLSKPLWLHELCMM